MSLIYKKIMDDIEKSIINNTYKSNKKLPSIRFLAAKYNCSKSTVVKALETLKNNHIIYSIPQSGYYVLENTLVKNTTNSPFIDFSTGNPNIGDMNIPDLKHSLDIAVDIYSNNSLNDNTYGVDSLRNLIPSYLSKFHVFTKPNNIFLNLGIQQLLSILSPMPFPNNKDIVLVENPTYKYFLQYLKFFDINSMSIDRASKGIDLNMLEHIFKNEKIKFFYTVPRFHNPLGTTYEKDYIKSIAYLASKYDVYIVEDDYFGDIVTDPKYDPIFSFGDYSHHIYLKSFSKLLPWIRIGITVMPDSLLSTFNQYRKFSYYSSYFSASLVSQATLEIYLKSNLLKKHINILTKEYIKRNKVLNNKLSKLNSLSIETLGGEGGFYSYIELPTKIKNTDFIKSLKSKGVILSSTDSCYFENKKNGVRISIAKSNSEDIEKGMDIIIDHLSSTVK
ncbi:PLP-dependent aminotransferase family protein [Clostridium hydrogeniformans]|uniref:aminotransferase-like domain-containing protein n=1 Tax=Clostridium hydrogeniformans TaxID=349933 RepID=UPI00048123F5|nr:PLP-dependent aminotransferase family protein [Clostridium hydrogeniformans]